MRSNSRPATAPISSGRANASLTSRGALVRADIDCTDAASSHATGAGLREARMGTVCCFCIAAHDASGNRRRVGGDTVLCRVDYPSDGASRQSTTEGHVIDNQDGSYDVRYCPAHACQQLRLRVLVNGAMLRGSPFHPKVIAGPTAAQRCTATGIGLTDGVTGEACRFHGNG